VSDLLLQLKNCPVCGIGHSGDDVVTDAFDFSDGERYLAPLARDLGISVNQLFQNVKSYRCSNCFAHYLNPWLSLSSRNRVFVSGHSIHNMGWFHFQQKITGGAGARLPLSPKTLISSIVTRHGPMHSYVELGCPFQGLLMHVNSVQTVPSTRKKPSLPITMESEEYKRLPSPAARYLRTRGLLDLGFFKLLKSFAAKPIKTSQETLVLPSLSFARLPSTKFWGENCSLYGNSCSASLSVAFGIPITSLDSLRVMPDQSIHTVGLFNVLDHLDDPLGILRLSLRLARVVVCCSHNQPFGIQHQVGMGHDFFKRLPNLIENCEVEILSESDSEDVLCFLSVNSSSSRAQFS